MSAETVTALAWKLRRAAEILDRDGDEHGVAADLRSMLADAGTLRPEQYLLLFGAAVSEATVKARVLLKGVDLQQIIYALERQERALQAHADRLCAELDYAAEFPSEDAERMREAVALLRPSVRASAEPVAPLTHEIAALEQQRPSVLYRPALERDGDQWCALYGADLQQGVAGFGDTPSAAMYAFDKAWCTERSNDSLCGPRPKTVRVVEPIGGWPTGD